MVSRYEKGMLLQNTDGDIIRILDIEGNTTDNTINLLLIRCIQRKMPTWGSGNTVHGLDAHNRGNIVGNYWYIPGCRGQVPCNFKIYTGTLHPDCRDFTLHRE